MPFFIISTLTAIVMYSVGLWAKYSTKPMQFWSGTKVDPSEITDMGAYNFENYQMWTTYALAIFLCGLFGIFNIFIGAFFLTAVCIGGIPCLIFRYSRIKKKYTPPKV